MEKQKSSEKILYEFAPSTMRVRDMPERIRPREEMERIGVKNMSDDKLLAIVLRTGVAGLNAVDLARGLLMHYGSLTELAKASTAELARIRGIGKTKAQILKAVLETGRRLSEENQPRQYTIHTPADVAALLREKARVLDQEVFWALNLDQRNHLKGNPVQITSGLLNASLVHAREVFREAVRSATAAIVLAHNHPSGDPSPSPEDIRSTRQLVEAGKIIDIKIFDHVIIGRYIEGKSRNFLSMREEGLVDFN